MDAIIYKICGAGAWREAVQLGIYAGSELDKRDGFIHFSTAPQLGETARLHFAHQADLVLVAVAWAGLDVRFEPSKGGGRGGALFPHLFGTLPIKHALWVADLPLDKNGIPQTEAVLVSHNKT